MAVGVATVPLAELAHEDGTPASRSRSTPTAPSTRPNRRTRTTPATSRTGGRAAALGLIAEAVLAERGAICAAVASATVAPSGSESGDVTAVIEQRRAGESPVAIARET